MDGRVGAIRAALDDDGSSDADPRLRGEVRVRVLRPVPRGCRSRRPSFGDRRGYQMDPANVREALRECELDVAEGADVLHGQAGAALPRRDPRRARALRPPVAAYNVSGEYAMVKAAAAQGWLDERRAALESLTAIKRAGADSIVTYWAKELAAWL